MTSGHVLRYGRRWAQVGPNCGFTDPGVEPPGRHGMEGDIGTQAPALLRIAGCMSDAPANNEVRHCYHRYAV